MLPARVASLFNVPLFRRMAFHARRIGTQVDRHFFTTLLTARLRALSDVGAWVDTARPTAVRTVACQVRKSFALTSSPITWRR